MRRGRRWAGKIYMHLFLLDADMLLVEKKEKTRMTDWG